MTYWIEIPRWDEFQHYRDRNPPWIKNYVRLLHDDAYLRLTGHQRAVLHGLWLEYASAGRHVALTTSSLSRRLALRVMTRDIEALRDAGFLTISASKPLAARYHDARPEGEGETETDLPKKVSKRKPVDNSLLLAAIDVAQGWNGRSSDEFEQQLDELERQHHGRLSYLQRDELWSTALRNERSS